jgi:hypothetical protein
MRRWTLEWNNPKTSLLDHCTDHVADLRLTVSLPTLALFAVIFLNGVVFVGLAAAQPKANSSNESIATPATAQYFDIPSEALEDALYAFDTTTGIEVFVDGNSVAGRRSAKIEGSFSPVDALSAMLAGTGLEAKTIGPKAITLAPEQPQGTANSLTYRSYSALVQNAVVRALCAEPDIRPGSYRIAAELWLTPTGIVSAANLLSSTGNPERDGRVRRVLVGISIGKLPPPALPQPIVMAILPRSSQQTGDCS